MRHTHRRTAGGESELPLCAQTHSFHAERASPLSVGTKLTNRFTTKAIIFVVGFGMFLIESALQNHTLFYTTALTPVA